VERNLELLNIKKRHFVFRLFIHP